MNYEHDDKATREHLLNLYYLVIPNPDERESGYKDKRLDILAGTVVAYATRIIEEQSKEIDRLKTKAGESDPFVADLR